MEYIPYIIGIILICCFAPLLFYSIMYFIWVMFGDLIEHQIKIDKARKSWKDKE